MAAELELEPVWSAALEAAGAVDGLSRYVGRSSIYQSDASWHVSPTRVRTIEDGETAAPRPAYVPRAKAAPRMSAERAGAIAVLLRRGVPYRKLVKDFGVTMAQVRTVARRLALTHPTGPARTRLGLHGPQEVA